MYICGADGNQHNSLHASAFEGISMSQSWQSVFAGPEWLNLIKVTVSRLRYANHPAKPCSGATSQNPFSTHQGMCLKLNSIAMPDLRYQIRFLSCV